MSAMKAPVFAAFAPGVFVSGRIVSAISSRKAISSAVTSSVAPATGRLAASQVASKPLPPTNAAPPSNALTRRIASPRLMGAADSGSKDVFMNDSKIAAIEFVHGKIRRARGDRHVGEGRVLTRRGGHAR